jgi:CMP-N-acetylneuraminic acid synthetase
VIRRDEDEVQKGIVDIRTRFKYFKHIKSDYVMLLNPCCPLVSEQTILKAYYYFQDNNYKSYTSAIKTRDWIFDMNSNAITRTDSSNVATNKGDYFYKATHMFHIINRKRFIDTGKIWTFTEDDPHCTLVSENEFYDVDTEDEFHMTEFAYKRSNCIGEKLVETKTE